MATLLPNGKQQYFANDGTFLSFGFLSTFEAGTTTPKPTYADAAATVENPTVIELDARGECVAFWKGAYDITLSDPLGNIIYSVQGISTTEATFETSPTGSMVVPSGSTSQRDDPAQNGYFRYNLDNLQFEGFSNGQWVGIQEQLVSGTSLKTINDISLLGSGDMQLPATIKTLVRSDTSAAAIDQTALSTLVSLQPVVAYTQPIDGPFDDGFWFIIRNDSNFPVTISTNVVGGIDGVTPSIIPFVIYPVEARMFMYDIGADAFNTLVLQEFSYTYNVSGTFNPPTRYTASEITGGGGGGGGGGAGSAAAGSVRNGASGGGGGARPPARRVPATLVGVTPFNVTIGAGGNGGTGSSTASGNAGSAGGTTTVTVTNPPSIVGTVPLYTAYGGGAGPAAIAAGSATSGGTGGGAGGAGLTGNTAGAIGGQPAFSAGPGGNSAGTVNNMGGGGGGANNATASGNAEYGGGAGGGNGATAAAVWAGGSSLFGGSGGGAGASLNSSNTLVNASAGGLTGTYVSGGGGVPGVSTNGGGTSGQPGLIPGSGGGGGGAAIVAGNGGVGGAGLLGGGGGGGGTATAGTGGNGGNGGAGWITIKGIK